MTLISISEATAHVLELSAFVEDHYCTSQEEREEHRAQTRAALNALGVDLTHQPAS